jgi:pyruvate dehydrogenase E1 component beta subunit
MDLKLITVREAIRDAIAEEMRRDKNIFLLGEEVGEYQGAYKVTQGLLEEFSADRIVDTPITEAGFTGLAIGASMNGLRPIVEFMTWNFAMQAIDHIINSAAKTFYMSGGKLNIPIVFRGPNGVASRVGAQHSQDYTAWYSHIPGLKVLAPYDAWDAKVLLKGAIRDNNPVVFLEHELLYNEKFEIPDNEDLLEYSNAKIMKKGNDISLISFSRGVDLALEVEKGLASKGFSAEVINLRSIKPLDIESITNSVKKTNRVAVIEEGWYQSGVGAEIIAVIIKNAFDFLDAPPLRFSGEDVPLPYAENLEKLALPNTEKILKECLEIL